MGGNQVRLFAATENAQKRPGLPLLPPPDAARLRPAPVQLASCHARFVAFCEPPALPALILVPWGNRQSPRRVVGSLSFRATGEVNQKKQA